MTNCSIEWREIIDGVGQILYVELIIDDSVHRLDKDDLWTLYSISQEGFNRVIELPTE